MNNALESGSETITDELRWHKLLMRRFEVGLIAAFENFRAAGIEPILFKGWAAARNYPPDRPRFFGDADIAIRREDFENAARLITTDGFASVGIDLHREFRHLDTVPWKTLFARSEVVVVDGTGIRILCSEDHLRVLCVHWLTDGGAYKDRLWDIYFAVERRPKDFDWDRCLNSVSKTRRRWVITTIALANRYLGLDVSALPFEAETEHIPNWIIRCVEQEWTTDVRLRPLHTCLRQPAILYQQILKRLPPNPIQATIDTEGEFDEGSRFRHQIGSIFVRIRPSTKRIVDALQSKKPPKAK